MDRSSDPVWSDPSLAAAGMQAALGYVHGRGAAGRRGRRLHDARRPRGPKPGYRVEGSASLTGTGRVTGAGITPTPCS